jgi:pSer/pThr/pTyr-binding forkhead associated (FHA) protein
VAREPDQTAVLAQSAQAPPPVSEPVPQRWDAVIVVDPSLYTEPDPAQPCPVGQPERLFPLYMDDNLVGRRDDRREIRPEIVVVDPGVSHRHLSFRRRNDGGFSVLELGSANGTTLNETWLEPGIDTPLTDGDRLTLGCWTRITIRAR